VPASDSPTRRRVLRSTDWGRAPHPPLSPWHHGALGGPSL